MLILVTLVDPIRTNALLPKAFSTVFEQIIDKPEVVYIPVALGQGFLSK